MSKMEPFQREAPNMAEAQKVVTQSKSFKVRCPGHRDHFLGRFQILCRIIFPSRCSHLLSWGPLTRERGVVGGYNHRSCGKMTRRYPWSLPFTTLHTTLHQCSSLPCKMTGHYPAHSCHNRTPKHTFNSKLSCSNIQRKSNKQPSLWKLTGALV